MIATEPGIPNCGQDAIVEYAAAEDSAVPDPADHHLDLDKTPIHERCDAIDSTAVEPPSTHEQPEADEDDQSQEAAASGAPESEKSDAPKAEPSLEEQLRAQVHDRQRLRRIENHMPLAAPKGSKAYFLAQTTGAAPLASTTASQAQAPWRQTPWPEQLASAPGQTGRSHSGPAHPGSQRLAQTTCTVMAPQPPFEPHDASSSRCTSLATQPRASRACAPTLTADFGKSSKLIETMA